MSYTVYCHKNKINGKIYIGITSQNAERRWQKGAGYYGTYFYNAIKKYGWDGFEHQILAEGLTKEQAEAMEIHLIAKHNSTDREIGYNIAEGGKVIVGVKGRVGGDHPNAEKINVFDKEHHYITTYDSQSTAAKELGISRKGITKNCQGKSSTFRGYIFEYADKEYQKPYKYPTGKHPNHYTVKVNLIDDNGNIIETFNSCKEAAEKYGCRANGIIKCLNGILKTYQGRRWCRAGV